MHPSHNFLTELRTFIPLWSDTGAASIAGWAMRGTVSAVVNGFAIDENIRTAGRAAAARRRRTENIVAAEVWWFGGAAEVEERNCSGGNGRRPTSNFSAVGEGGARVWRRTMVGHVRALDYLGRCWPSDLVQSPWSVRGGTLPVSDGLDT